MPRAFLITHRRYNTTVEYQRRESSPERRVSIAEPERHHAGHCSSSDVPSRIAETTPECPEELYNLTQLAEVSLAAAAGHLFTHHHRDYNLKKYHFINNHRLDFNKYKALLHHHEDNRSDHESDRYSEHDLSWDHYEDHDGELKDGTTASTGEVHGCPDCGKRYSTSSNLARHRQTHRSLGDKKARRCPHCDKIYVSMPAFSMHVRTHNQGCKCSHCGKCFSRPWLLQGHIRTHTGEKPFKCSICTKSFADKSNLRAHVQTHSNTKPYICRRCDKAFALKSYLYKHEESSCMRVHGEMPPTPPTPPTPATLPTVIRSCPIAI